jgi:hypothetical protein
LLAGLYGFVGFLTILAVTVEPFGVTRAFDLATAAALAVNALLLVRASWPQRQLAR